jgi:hypothetical protein
LTAKFVYPENLADAVVGMAVFGKSIAAVSKIVSIPSSGKFATVVVTLR